MEGDEFLRRMRLGDASVFDELMPILEKLVHGACSSFRIFDQRRDDVVQDVALKVFRQWKSYESQSKLSTWLYAIARNCCLDELRQQNRAKNRTVELGVDAETGEDLINKVQDQQLSSFEQRLCVQQLLAELHAEPPARKGSMRKIEVLTFWVINAPTTEELAAFLKTTASAATTRKGAVLSKIRELCKKYCGHEECRFSIAA